MEIALKNPTILAIDDDVEITELLETAVIMRNLGFLSANDGETGLNKAKLYQPDLIFLDINLPRIDGYHVCKELKSNIYTSNIPIIMMSASDDERTRDKCIQNGAVKFLAKPFEIKYIYSYINKYLATQHPAARPDPGINDRNQVETIYTETLNSFIELINTKDYNTHYHSKRVAEYTTIIAERLNLARAEITALQHAAELHDLGKISIPQKILCKPDKLTKREWEIIKKHPSAGAAILKPLSFFSGIIEIISQHHEKHDGSGYPEGIKGKNITLGARIIAVADAYEAMTNNRPYRTALTNKEAAAELIKYSGAQFDPEIVNKFISIL